MRANKSSVLSSSYKTCQGVTTKEYWRSFQKLRFLTSSETTVPVTRCSQRETFVYCFHIISGRQSDQLGLIGRVPLPCSEWVFDARDTHIEYMPIARGLIVLVFHHDSSWIVAVSSPIFDLIPSWDCLWYPFLLSSVPAALQRWPEDGPRLIVRRAGWYIRTGK